MKAGSIDQLEFRLDDCVVEAAQNTELKRPWKLYEIQRQEEMGGSSMRTVTVTHLPTGISYSEDRFMPKRNREIAIEAVKARVNELIKKVKAQGQKDADK